MDYYVVTFEATSHALRAERVLKQNDFHIFTVPTPRYLSSNCGIALKFHRELKDQIEIELNKFSCPYDSIHKLTKN